MAAWTSPGQGPWAPTLDATSVCCREGQVAGGWGCWEAPSQARSVGVRGLPGLPPAPAMLAPSQPSPSCTHQPSHPGCSPRPEPRGALDWPTAGGPALKPENGASSPGFTRPCPQRQVPPFSRLSHPASVSSPAQGATARGGSASLSASLPPPRAIATSLHGDHGGAAGGA